MAKKRPKPEKTISKFRQVNVLMGQGMPRIDAIRQIGAFAQSYCRRNMQYGGMGVDQQKELKRLQRENDRPAGQSLLKKSFELKFCAYFSHVQRRWEQVLGAL